MPATSHPGAKRAFISTILNFFSHTALLSYQRDAEIAEIDLDIALNLLALNCNKVDINLPEYPHLIELIRGALQPLHRQPHPSAQRESGSCRTEQPMRAYRRSPMTKKRNEQNAGSASSAGSSAEVTPNADGT